MKNNPTTADGSTEPALAALEARFVSHPERHPDMDWTALRERLEVEPAKLRSLAAMEATGGEPDVVGRDAATGEYLVCDCSAESPAGRRSLCYDRGALAARKEAKPRGSAVGMAEEMGIELLSEGEYAALQRLGSFDSKTSSWLRTPEGVRKLGGAIFGDRRYDRAFVYHNGAESYYAARGFRGMLRV